MSKRAAWSRPSSPQPCAARAAARFGTSESYDFLEGEPPDTVNPSLLGLLDEPDPGFVIVMPRADPTRLHLYVL